MTDDREHTRMLVAQHVADVLNFAGPDEKSPGLAASLMTLVQQNRAERLMAAIKATDLLIVDGKLFMDMIAYIDSTTEIALRDNLQATYAIGCELLKQCLTKGHIKYENQ